MTNPVLEVYDLIDSGAVSQQLVLNEMLSYFSHDEIARFKESLMTNWGLHEIEEDESVVLNEDFLK